MGILDEMLEGKKSIVILGHVNPDGDCIGSCLGLYNYLKENYEGLEISVYLEKMGVKFSYLSGYLADKYDQEPDDLTERVYERMEKSVKDSFEKTVYGYATVVPRQEKIAVTGKGKVKYALFPVWFLNTKWNGKNYSFAMNGQTGHLIGDLPVAGKLAVKYWFRHHIPLTVLAVAAVTLLRLLGVM